MTFSEALLSLISWFSPRSNWTSYSSPHPLHHPWVTSHPHSPTHPFWKITSDVGCNSFNVTRHAFQIIFITNWLFSLNHSLLDILLPSPACYAVVVWRINGTAVYGGGGGTLVCRHWIPLLPCTQHLPRNILHTAGRRAGHYTLHSNHL